MKFTIVTPAFNMERWIGETIESVLSQKGDFEIEYILQDGGSTDKTVEVFKDYKARLEQNQIPLLCKKITMIVAPEKDEGPFDAINKGFAKATGDFYTWADADNTYAQGALAGLAAVLTAFPDIQWLRGYSSTMDEAGRRLRLKQSAVYRQDWLQDGIYGMEAYFVQADTVFFSAALWSQVGPIPGEYKRAGDHWLWMQMAKHAPLWCVNLQTTNYRKRQGQLSMESRAAQERWLARPRRSLKAWGARLFFSPQSRMAPRGERFFLWLYPLLFMRGKHRTQYIDFVNGAPVKKWAKTFIIGDNPSYADVPETLYQPH